MATRAGRWLDSVATPRRILWLGWVLFVIYCYPGYMSTDSVNQLEQARATDPLHDWHPPLMAMLWRVTDSVIAGPFPMLIIQSVAFLLGLDGILRRVLRPRTAAVLASLILLFPPVMTTMAVIWKDSQMAGFLLAGTACLLSANRKWKLAGCVLLFFATAQRYNSIAATFPIVLALFVWREELTRWRRYAIAFGVWIAITVAAFGTNKLLTEQKLYAWHGSVALFDIVGTIRYAQPLPDGEVRELLAGVTVIPTEDIQYGFRLRYFPRAWWELANGPKRVLEAPKTEEQREAVARAWRDVVMTYPVAYLKHRLRVFREVIGISKYPPGAEWDGFTENPAQEPAIKHSAMHSKVQARWLSLIPAIQDSLPFRAWAYLLLGFALLPLCRRQRLAFVVIASGLLNELSLFVAAPSADYRYSHWMIACTIIGIALVFAARWRSGQAGGDAGSSAGAVSPSPP